MMAPPPRYRIIAAAPVVIACAWLALRPHADIGAILTGLASCTAIAASGERRTRTMLLGAGLSLGLGAGGLLVLPAFVGLAIARRGSVSLLFGGLAGIATLLATGTWSTGATIPTLWSLAIRWPDLLGLAAAAMIGFSAWIAASATTLGYDQRALALASLTCALGIGLMVPMPAASLFLPLIMLVCRLIVARPLPSCANDNGAVRSSPRGKLQFALPRQKNTYLPPVRSRRAPRPLASRKTGD
jgi:hypothetical protein